MRSFLSPLLATGISVALALSLTACKPQDAGNGDTETSRPSQSDAAGETPSVDGGAKAKAFDITQLPISDAPLGAFPYLGLPDGYQSGKPTTRKFERVPYWTGDRIEWVEGQVTGARITAQENDGYSQLELVRNIDSLVTSLGGKRIFSGRIPAEGIAAMDESGLMVDFVDGFGDIYNNPSDTFVIHRADRDIWIHLGQGAYSGSWLITETKPVAITAKVLPASELGAALDNGGKVSLQVQFDTDKATLLPEAKPQLEQIAALLKQAPELRLAIHGHTDNTGEAQHNLQLSRQRAAAVVDYLRASGIEQSRLASDGFGATQPVADNDSEAGKAQNRRVELLKL